LEGRYLFDVQKRTNLPSGMFFVLFCIFYRVHRDSKANELVFFYQIKVDFTLRKHFMDISFTM